MGGGPVKLIRSSGLKPQDPMTFFPLTFNQRWSAPRGAPGRQRRRLRKRINQKIVNKHHFPVEETMLGELLLRGIKEGV